MSHENGVVTICRRTPWQRAWTEPQAADIARLEEIADIADVEPRVRISYELDCAKHLARQLNLYVKVNGKVRTVDKPGDWKAISPRENSVRLFTNSVSATST